MSSLAAGYSSLSDKCHACFSGTRTCPECGYVLAPRGREIETLDGNLVEIGAGAPDEEQGRLQFLGELRGICTERGYQPGWAAHRPASGSAHGRRASGTGCRRLCRHWRRRAGSTMTERQRFSSPRSKYEIVTFLPTARSLGINAPAVNRQATSFASESSRDPASHVFTMSVDSAPNAATGVSIEAATAATSIFFMSSSAIDPRCPGLPKIMSISLRHLRIRGNAVSVCVDNT